MLFSGKALKIQDDLFQAQVLILEGNKMNYVFNIKLKGLPGQDQEKLAEAIIESLSIYDEPSFGEHLIKKVSFNEETKESKYCFSFKVKKWEQ